MISGSIPQEDSVRRELPLEVEFAGTNFAVLGDVDRKNTIYVKSKMASLELLGSYPIENIDTSVSKKTSHLSDLLLNLFTKQFNWVASLPMAQTTGSPGSGRLFLGWEGFSTTADKKKVKQALDQSAMDISSAALRGDFWRTVLAVSPVILQCQLAHQKARRIQVFACLVFLLILSLFLLMAVDIRRP
jgi:hypothetical protein